MPIALSLDTVVAAAADQVSSEVDGQQVILSLQTGTYYGLDGVGARVWSLLKEPCAISQICDVIASEYEVERKRCEQDMLALLAQLAENELIEVRDAATAGAPAPDAG